MHPARRPRRTKASGATASELLEHILSVLDENKAEDIVTIDLAGKTPMADFMVVANGRSQRQVQALADYVGRALKEVAKAPKIEGQAQGDWILIDAGDVIVHLFRPEVRDFYKIEAMWGHETPSAAMEPAVS